MIVFQSRGSQPNPIRNSNSRYLAGDILWLIQYLIPIQGTPIPEDDFDYRYTCSMNLDSIQYPIPIPWWGIKIDILTRLWPIQYLIPIQGTPISNEDFVNRYKCSMNLDPIQYPIPIPRWGIKIDILARLRANPIPNPNSRHPHIK